jgi:hypothetical protein
MNLLTNKILKLKQILYNKYLNVNDYLPIRRFKLKWLLIKSDSRSKSGKGLINY